MAVILKDHHKTDFLSNRDLTVDQTWAVIERALALKTARPERRSPVGTVALLFQKTSTRTRCSFESGLVELGYHPMVIDWGRSNFTLADLKDEARVLGGYADMIMARMNSQADLELMAQASPVPVINGMTEKFHPCQALGDMLTIRERFGGFDGVQVGYVGDGGNVCQSLIQACALLGVPIRIAHPEGYGPGDDILADPQVQAVLTVADTARDAVAGVAVVYTDAWIGIGMDAEREARLAAFAPYQVDLGLFGHADRQAIFMHCLPAHRGEEVTDAVMDHDRSRIFDQARNRKYAQMALIEHLAAVNAAGRAAPARA